MIDGGVVLAWSSSGMVHHAFMDSVLATIAELQELCVGWIGQESGPLVATGRNNIVRTFLTGTFRGGARGEWLLFIDADMVYDRRAVQTMLAVADVEQTPILGGLCFGGGRGGHIFPTLYVATDERLHLDRINEYPKDTLCKVDATGGAFLLVHRSVLERMYEAFGVVRDDQGEVVLDEEGHPVETPYPWFTYGANAGKPTGEDIAFCLRARALDIPVHVHTGIRIGHIKPQILDEELYDRLRAEAQAKAKQVNGKLTPIHQGRTTVSQRKRLSV